MYPPPDNDPSAAATLDERQCAIPVRRDRVAVLAIGGMAAAVAHDPGSLLAVDITVDAGHPRADFVHQLALTKGQHMLRPFGNAGGRGLDSCQTAFGGELDQIADPLDAIFGSARVVSEPGMRAHRHQKVRETFHQYAEIGLRAVFPQILQPHAIDAPDVDAIKGAGDRVKPGRVDDDVEIVFAVAGLDAVRRDALDRRLVDVDEFDVGLVVNLVIPGFERHPAGAEAMVLRDQLFGDHGVFNALADLARDEVGGQLVGLAIGQHVAEIAHPDAETRLSVELLPEGLPFFGW